MDERKGILDNFLAPLGNAIVDPNGAVSQSMNQETLEEKRLRELAAARARAQESSVMEVAPTVAEPKQLSSWNPFVLLFGQPGNEGDKGLMGR